MRWEAKLQVWYGSEMHTEIWSAHESQRSIGRPRCGWKNNIKMENVDWIHLSQIELF